jgi:immunity protein 17 of polymorphic toxin system
MGWLFAGCGAFAICGAAFDWDWFMNNHKARLFVILLGRRGARLVYGFLGSGLVVLGALMATGLLQESR